MTARPQVMVAGLFAGMLAATGVAASNGVAPLLAPDSGGAATASGDAREVLAEYLAGLSEAQYRTARRGEAFFNTSFVPSPSRAQVRDGLGPLFNSGACRSCHNSLGRGSPPTDPGQQPVALVLQLSTRSADGSWGMDPIYGANFNPFAVEGFEPEGRVVIERTPLRGRYADGTEWVVDQPAYRLEDLRYGALHPATAISPRLAQPIIGMGLLQAVPEETILALADPDDRDGDGISGRANWLHGKDGEKRLGRFGWKSNQPDILAQTVAALSQEQGITSSHDPAGNCTAAQRDCRAAPIGAELEIEDADVDALVLFQRVLAVPPRRNLDRPAVARGAALFRQADCAACHVPTLETAAVADLPALSEQRIHAYTDLLLHDMGPGLADGRPDHQATGSEWRTPPLWGLGRTPDIARGEFYLHDGRARTLEEAVLWHGGEAAAARARFIVLPPADRAALIAFLRSL